jgi:hypothetical protein
MDTLFLLLCVTFIEFVLFGVSGWFIGKRLENNEKSNMRVWGLLIGLILGSVVCCISSYFLIPADYFGF